MISCFFENQNKAFLRHVTVDAIIIEGNKILLVKRASHLTNGDKYALPGGFLDRDETLEKAIKREVFEETGYKTQKVTLFRINDKPDRKGEDRQNVDFVFLVEVGEKKGESDHEVKECVWFEVDKLPHTDEFAFDHYENIEMYLKWKKENFILPALV